MSTVTEYSKVTELSTVRVQYTVRVQVLCSIKCNSPVLPTVHSNVFD